MKAFLIFSFLIWSSGLLLAGPVLSQAPTPSANITFSVNITTDARDADLSDGKCLTSDNKCSLRELLRPLEQTADLCGMQVLAPFALFGSRTAVEENRVHCHVDDRRQIAEALRDDRLDLQQGEGLAMLNGQLSTLIGKQA